MPSISDKLRQINEIKQGIKEAIIAGGGAVGDDFSKYPEAVSQFSIDYKNPDFYDIRTQKGTNYDSLFRGYNGPDIDVSQWDTSKVTSAQYCFAECKKSINISNWDLSSLTNVQYMFSNFTNNNKYIDLSVLDFSNVTNVSDMFYYSNTDYLDVRNINLTGTTSYSSLFYQCNGTELDLSSWDISNITDLNYMCYNSSFKKIDLTGWKTTNVKNFSNMFYGYTNTLNILIIPDWDMTNATSTSSFIYNGSSKLKYIDLSRSNDFTINKIASFLPTKTATTYGEVVIPANTSQDAIDAVTAKYWKPIGPKIDLNSTELIFELDEIKPGKTTKVYNGNNDPWYGDDRPETIEFISSDESIATVNGREITGVAEGTVTIECRRREDNVVVGSTTLTVSETDSKPNLIKFRTNGTEGSTTVLLTVNGTSIDSRKCTKNVSGVYSYDAGKQITSFKFTSYITEIVKFNYSAVNITDMTDMFRYGKIKILDITGLDTSKVTRMYQTFEYNVDTVEIIGEIDMSKVSNVNYMFHGTSNLEVVYLKNIYKNCNMSNDSSWSIDLGSTKVKDECLIYIINELPDLYAKGLTDTYNIYFELPLTNTLTAEQVQPAIDKGWTVRNCNF